MSKGGRMWLPAAVLAALIGCSAPDSGSAEGSIEPIDIEIGSAAPPRVSLAPGDEIEVKFYYAPELNETQVIRPDGAIALQLVGEVPVQGLTPGELGDELKSLYAPMLRNPEATVIIRNLVDRRVFVGGAVGAPGLVEMPGRMSALAAIMQAGGFDPDRAKWSNVVVIRHQNGQRYGCSLDFGPALDGEPYAPFFLEPNDIVFVPEMTIVGVTRWIDQHINQIIPIGFTFTQTRGNTTLGIDTGGFRGGR